MSSVQATPPLRVGVVGPGAHCQRDLLPSLSLAAGLKIVAISSRDLDKARALAARWGAERAESDWRALASPRNVDLIVVAGPPTVHYEVARHCLEAGVHVFVDKPPAQTSEQLEQLVLAERSSKALGFVGFNFPFAASYQRFSRILKQTGRLSRYHVRFVSKQPRGRTWECPDLFSTLLLSSGTHAIDLVTRELGAPTEIVARAHAMTGSLLGIQILLGFPGNALATIDLGNYSNRFELRCEGVSETGACGVIEQLNRLKFWGLPTTGEPSNVGDGSEVTEYELPFRRGGYERTGYQTMFESLRDSISSGGWSASPFELCRAAYRIIDESLRQLRGSQ